MSSIGGWSRGRRRWVFARDSCKLMVLTLLFESLAERNPCAVEGKRSSADGVGQAVEDTGCRLHSHANRLG